MADGIVGYTPGTGANVAADDLGAGGLAQRIKIVLGASGTDGGDVAFGNPMPVTGTVAVTNAGLLNLDVALSTRLKPADTLAGVTTVAAVTAITNALPAGTNLLGKVGIDQTTPGTTNKVSIGTDGTVAINAALPTGANTIGAVNVIGTIPVSGTFWQATQPVSGTVAVSNMVAQGLTDTQLRATAVPVSLAVAPITPVTGTFWQATQPVSGTVTANAGTGTFAVSAASLPLPTGAATETSLAAINTKVPAQGQALMAASLPVSIASNQSAIPVSGTFWQATQPVSLASLPALAAGANTIGAVTQAAGPWTMKPDGTVWALTGTSANVNVTNTVPVTLASTTITGAVAVTGTFFQATQPVSAASLPLPTGAATSAKQPALGTAGVASADVISVQGVASGTAMPVSGTFWQSIQPISGSISQAAIWTTQESGPQMTEVLRQVLIELRVLNGMMQEGLFPGRSLGNTTLDSLRNDEDISINLVG